jgi:hypothetical protein
MRASEILKRARAYLFKRSRTRSVFAGVALVVTLSLILSTGPHIQKHILALLNSNAPSIYGTAYENMVAAQVDLRDWLLSSFAWPYVLMAGIITELSELVPSRETVWRRC